jgi:hypothetical protein
VLSFVRKHGTFISIHHTDEFEFDLSCVIRGRLVQRGGTHTGEYWTYFYNPAYPVYYIFLFSCGVLLGFSVFLFGILN